MRPGDGPSPYSHHLFSSTTGVRPWKERDPDRALYVCACVRVPVWTRVYICVLCMCVYVCEYPHRTSTDRHDQGRECEGGEGSGTLRRYNGGLPDPNTFTTGHPWRGRAGTHPGTSDGRDGLTPSLRSKGAEVGGNGRTRPPVPVRGRHTRPTHGPWGS